MPYSFTLTTIIPASAQEIYDAWLDSLEHSEMTGGPATMSDEVGADVSAWGGYITGRNLELVPGARIVQSWRTSEFTDELEDSIITVTLEEVDDGTLLTLEHSNVPDAHRSYEEGGWQSNYFEPMVAYFAAGEEDEETVEAPEKPVAKAPAPRRKATTAPKKAPAAKKAAEGGATGAAKSAPKRAAKKAVKKAAKKAPKKAAKKATKKAVKKVPKKAAKKAVKKATKKAVKKAAKRPRAKKAARGKRK